MQNKLMLGLWRFVINVPPFLWKKQIAQGKRAFERSYGRLSEEERTVHHFVVKELVHGQNRYPHTGFQKRQVSCLNK